MNKTVTNSTNHTGVSTINTYSIFHHLFGKGGGGVVYKLPLFCFCVRVAGGGVLSSFLCLPPQG